MKRPAHTGPGDGGDGTEWIEFKKGDRVTLTEDSAKIYGEDPAAVHTVTAAGHPTLTSYDLIRVDGLANWWHPSHFKFAHGR